MKIIHIFSGIGHQGGLPVEVRQLIKSQIRLGNKIYVVSDLRKNINKPILDGVAKILYLKGCVINKYNELKLFLKDIKPDYLHLYGGWDFFNFICWYTINKLNLPFIITIHGNLSPFIYKYRFGGRKNWLFYEQIKKGYQYFIDFRIFKDAMAIHCLSEYERVLCKERQLKGKYIVLPFGINDFYRPTKRLSRINGSKIIFIGRMDIFQKGLDILVEAVNLLNNKDSTLNFTVDVFGPEISNSGFILKKMLKEYAITNINIRGTLSPNNVHSNFYNYDYLILPSRYEGLAKVVREAITVGLPIIASRESNFGDWISKFNLGFCIQELTPKGVADAIEKAILTDDATYEKFVENTKKWAEQFTWDNIAKFLNLEIQLLLNGKYQ